MYKRQSAQSRAKTNRNIRVLTLLLGQKLSIVLLIYELVNVNNNIQTSKCQKILRCGIGGQAAVDRKSA